MKRMFFLLLAVMVAGCGYSTRSLISDQYRTIFVPPFENKINYMAQDNRRIYIPGLEGKVREAVVGRYLFDGNLRIATEDAADLVLKGQLLGFEREELRLDQNGLPVAVIGVNQDITDRKKDHEALRDSELRYHNLFDQANEGLILLSRDGKLVEVNKSFAE
ncbi:MAG: PAS domain-containing protein, partial [Candidatus Omnitrophota bacterium]